MKVTTKSITAIGVGRVDNSDSAEYSTKPLIRSHLRRDAWTGEWHDLPIGIFPTVINIEFLIDSGVCADPDLAIPGACMCASSIINHINDFFVSVDANVLIFLSFRRYASWADLVADIPEKVFWTEYGYGMLSMRFSAGIPTIPGKYYGWSINIWTDKPTINLRSSAYSIEEKVVTP